MSIPTDKEHAVDTGVTFVRRVLGVMRFDPAVFDEVEADGGALLQAGAVVLVAGLARGIAGLSSGSPGIVGAIAGALVVWLLAAAILTLVGVHWLRGTSDFREMLRTLGFAAAPLWFLAPLVVVGGALHVVASAALHAWAIAAAGLAVRQALDAETPRALAACGLSLALAVALIWLVRAQAVF